MTHPHRHVQFPVAGTPQQAELELVVPALAGQVVLVQVVPALGDPVADLEDPEVVVQEEGRLEVREEVLTDLWDLTLGRDSPPRS